MNSLKSAPSLAEHNEPIIPLAQRKTMTTLLPDDCRWPIGDPQAAGFHFCGKHKQSGHPYCEFHVRRACSPGRPRLMTYRPRDAA
jgi:GcrA cell cycle regulator